MAYRDDLSASGAAQRPAADGALDVRPAAPAQPPATAVPPPVEAAPRPKSRKRRILAVVATAAAIVGGYLGHGWWVEGRFMVTTDDAYVGAHTTLLAAKASGYVALLAVGDNAAVDAGQVIAQIDDGDYRLAVQAAADKLATQAASVVRIGRQADAARAAVAQAQAQLAATRADSVRTVSDFDRQTRLSQSDFASKSRLEQSLADRDRSAATVKGAEAGLLSAQANVAVLGAQAQEAERVAAEYRTALAKAERDLSFTTIRAPAAGIVGNRAIEVGSYVQPGTRVAALVPLSSVYVDANFKETQLGRIRPGQSATVEVDALPGRAIPAVVDSIAPASGSQFSLLPPENATGNFTKIVQRVPVRLKVDADAVAEGVLRPGLSVVARIDARTGPAARTAGSR